MYHYKHAMRVIIAMNFFFAMNCALMMNCPRPKNIKKYQILTGMLNF